MSLIVRPIKWSRMTWSDLPLDPKRSFSASRPIEAPAARHAAAGRTARMVWKTALEVCLPKTRFLQRT